MMSGKNEQEIKELIEELSDHLTEAEKSGRSVADIIGQTPEQYMASLKQEMKTDYKRLVKFLPVYFLGVIAYFLIGPAIRGEFELNIIQVIGMPILAVLGLAIYVYFLQNAGRKQYSKKKFFLGGMVASAIVTTLAILIIVVSSIFVNPFYRGDTTADLIVIMICSSIFIGTAIWSKTWVSIWIPAFLIIPDVFTRFTNWSVESILMINMASFVMMFVVIILNILFIEKKKNKLV
ncbi:HAAS domain-containing protein [Bacillus sp. JJ1562]|uniref:HAAS domain-containing protein n=1 Tax=Bacillus sp. JJ1562 TaxID=3122960 RepID=UPI003003A1A4